MEKCRREYARVDVSWPVSIFAGAGLIEGEVKNISLGGALINCQSLPELEETFSLTIEIPNYLFPVTARVKKVRLNIYDSETDQTSVSYELAVRFIDISKEDRQIFHGTIDRAFRTKTSPPIERKISPKPTHRIDNNLLVTVEKLSLTSGRSFKDLLEEALQDLIHKYDKQASDTSQSLQP